VRIALVEEEILEDVIRCCERRFHVAELEGLQPVDVARLAVGMNARLRVLQRLERIRNGFQEPVFHLDQVQSLRRRLLVPGYHGGHRVADVAHVLRGERVFVLRHRQDAEADGKVLARQDEMHPRVGLRVFCPYLLDESMRMGRSQEAHVQHARQDEVVGEARLAGDLGAAVDPPARLTDDLHVASSLRPLQSLRISAGSRCSGTGCPTRLP
jgi:hypothetical protein